HYAREPLTMEGGTTFTFVTDGIESALDQAKRAAGGRDVALAGGARAAQQYLQAGLVDEMQLHIAPLLLGGGERLFVHVDEQHGLELVEAGGAPSVLHAKFAGSGGYRGSDREVSCRPSYERNRPSVNTGRHHPEGAESSLDADATRSERR